MMDLPRPFVIRESTHRIHNPMTPAKLARLGEALLLQPGQPLGTADLLAQSLRERGTVLVGEPYWVQVPASDELARACHARDTAEWSTLPELVSSFQAHGLDLVQVVLAGTDDWDAYHGLQWLNLRRWLDANPADELWGSLRAELDRAPADHLAVREHVGWGVFALMAR